MVIKDKKKENSLKLLKDVPYGTVFTTPSTGSKLLMKIEVFNAYPKDVNSISVAAVALESGKVIYFEKNEDAYLIDFEGHVL